MNQKIVKTIELENGHTLKILDLSRKISDDAFLVAMKACMEIKIEKDLFFFNPLSDFKFQNILELLGDKAVYEYKIERNFIMAPDKDTVFENIVGTYFNNLGHYVAKPDFPGKFVLREYKNRLK